MPDNIVLVQLREMRAEQTAASQRMEAQIGILAAGQVSIRAEMKVMRDEIKVLREEVHGMRDSIHEIAIAVDSHSARLDLIEKHLGLHLPKH